MRLKLSFLHIKENAMVAASCCGDIFHRQELGNSDWVRIEGMMDGVIYREILQGNLFQSFRDLRLGRRFTFQQHNGLESCFSSILKWFKGKHLNVLEWPSQIPDLNPIENLWYNLKISVHQQNPSNLKELEQFCFEKWEKKSHWLDVPSV